MFLVDMTFKDLKLITPELTQHHRDYLAEEYEKGNLMFGGRKQPRTGGVILSSHQDIESLQQMLTSDPFVKSGAVDYSITEFIPVMASTKFADLIEV